MFIELTPTGFGKIYRLFQGHKQYVPALAVIEGNFPGRVFVDEVQHPAVAIVWALGRWAYIEGDHQCRELGSLPDLVADAVIPTSQNMGVDWFELYVPNSHEWTGVINESLRRLKPGRHYESVYTWDRSAYHRSRSQYSCPDDVTLQLDEFPILPERVLNTRFVADEFRTHTAIGCKATVNGDVVALCRSNGFAVGDEFMIDVVTYDSNLRGRGYATAAATGLLDHCLEKELIPLWETTEDNVASRRLAHRLGFEVDETYPVYAVDF